VTSSFNGQVRPAAANRFSVSRTVDGTTPVRRAIWCFDTPAYPKRTISRTWRMQTLPAGINPLLG
jgi:hypothetical protein